MKDPIPMFKSADNPELTKRYHIIKLLKTKDRENLKNTQEKIPKQTNKQNQKKTHYYQRSKNY